jgi:hypothetical protein
MPVLGVVGDVLADPGHVRHDPVQAADRRAPAAQPLVPARLRVRRPLEVPLLARSTDPAPPRSASATTAKRHGRPSAQYRYEHYDPKRG